MGMLRAKFKGNPSIGMVIGDSVALTGASGRILVPQNHPELEIERLPKREKITPNRFPLLSELPATRVVY